jgi:LiaF transmembrane domain/Cell wall-active antibiotics response LiaF, C-terminal
MIDTDVTRPDRRRAPATPQLLMGLLIIAVGLLFTLDNLGVAHAADYLRYWPAGLIAIGLVKLWDSRDGHGGGFGGFMITLIGLWLLLEAAVDIRISFADMWPMLLVFAGSYLVWRGLTGQRRLAAADDHAIVSAVAILSGVNRGNNSPAFRGGDITAIMGGCDIDLRQAAINGDAVIDVFAVWGGIEIRVPDNWSVILHVTPVLGGVEDKTRPSLGSAEHRLTVRGLVVMGSVEVKN